MYKVLYVRSLHSLQKMVYYLPLWRHDTIYPNLTSFTLGVKHAKTPQGPTIDSCRWLLKATHSFTSKLLISSYKKLVKLQDDTSFLKEASKLGALFVNDKDSPHISLKMGNRIHYCSGANLNNLLSGNTDIFSLIFYKMSIFKDFPKQSLGLEQILVVGNTVWHKTVLSHELENREGHFSHHFRILSRFLHSTTYHPPIVLTLQATFQANIIFALWCLTPLVSPSSNISVFHTKDSKLLQGRLFRTILQLYCY